MLLAAAGQTAPYTYESSATRKISNNNNSKNVSNVSAGTSSPTTTTATGAGGVSAAIAARPTTASSIASTAASALMKTLSVRLHRGTEFIKDTVQKALVMSATTPVLAQQVKPLDNNQSLKRKLIGTGGIMNSSASIASGSRQYLLNQPYVVPTTAYLQRFCVAPTSLHRSASARKRNASTDSLLMDLCLFKPIRPMPITPIKINKARGFELKRPKFMPPAVNLYSDADDDDDDDEDYEVEHVNKEPELPHKPKLSTLTLPQHVTTSAFVPHEVISSSSITQIPAQTRGSSNTHTSGSGSRCTADSGTGTGTAKVKPKATATKRRRRAPLLTAKRRRKTSAAAAAAAAKELESAELVTVATTTTVKPKTAVAAVPAAVAATAVTATSKRNKRNAAGVAASSTSISPMRHSPPMTRQRARRQISASIK